MALALTVVVHILQAALHTTALRAAGQAVYASVRQVWDWCVGNTLTLQREPNWVNSINTLQSSDGMTHEPRLPLLACFNRGKKQAGQDGASL